MIKTLNRLQELKKIPYDNSRDGEALLELYNIIYEAVHDKDTFIQQSADMMNALQNGSLTEQAEKQWLVYACDIYAPFMTVRIYEQLLQGTLCLSPEEFDQVLEYYLQGSCSNEIASIGIYVCARWLEEKDPMRAYQLTKHAFTVNPDLAGILGIKYRYEGNATEEELTEECPYCGSAGDDIIPYYCSPQVARLENNQTFPPAKLWMKCGHCGNYFVYNFPKSNVGLINGHYTQDKKKSLLESRFPLCEYNMIFNRFKKLTSGRDYLEIGIGNGEMLAVALEFGYHAEAVEICREDCERISSALDVDIKWCDITDYETDKQYDVIVMGDVLEHVIEPVKVLKKAKQMLKEDGVLWISTPNYNCAYARMEKFTHCMWHELNHYTYVSYESLNELLQGLHMEVLHYDMSIRYRGSMELYIKHQTK